MTAGRPMIQLEHVTKRFGSKTAVDDLSIEVGAGELLAFLGPNGAGKTTTLKILCGLLEPTAGVVRVGGFDLATQGQQARQLLSYVPDQPYLYDKLTGREFLQFVSDMYAIPPAVGRQRTAELIELFEMADYVDDLTQNYSHGMKQRLVFAAALVHEPRVLVVDEPMIGLDPRSARLVKDLLRAKARAGAAVLMSTHTLAVAEEVADRIAILDHGQVLAIGTLSQLRHAFQTEDSLEDLFLRLTARGEENLRIAGRG